VIFELPNTYTTKCTEIFLGSLRSLLTHPIIVKLPSPCRTQLATCFLGQRIACSLLTGEVLSPRQLSDRPQLRSIRGHLAPFELTPQSPRPRCPPVGLRHCLPVSLQHRRRSRCGKNALFFGRSGFGWLCAVAAAAAFGFGGRAFLMLAAEKEES